MRHITWNGGVPVVITTDKPWLVEGEGVRRPNKRRWNKPGRHNTARLVHPLPHLSTQDILLFVKLENKRDVTLTHIV